MNDLEQYKGFSGGARLTKIPNPFRWKGDHTPEPWNFHTLLNGEAQLYGNCEEQADENGDHDALSSGTFKESDAQRIKQCVNACRDIEDPEKTIQRMKEALVFLRDVLDRHLVHGDYDGLCEDLQDLDNIARPLVDEIQPIPGSFDGLSPAQRDLLVLREFNRRVGKIYWAWEINGYVGDDSEEIDLCTPVLVRVVSTDNDSILHVNDDWHDPYWNVELLQKHPEIPEDLRSCWVHGNSFNANTGEVQPCRLLLATPPKEEKNGKKD